MVGQEVKNLVNCSMPAGVHQIQWNGKDEFGNSVSTGIYFYKIFADTYSETIKRAYITSFLVTYGYATLEIYRLEEEIYLKPFKKPRGIIEKKPVISIPISISVQDWMKWREDSQG